MYARFFSPNDKRNEMNYVYKYIEYSNKPTRTYQHILITLSTSIHPLSVPNHPPSPAYKYNTLRNVCQLHLQKSDLRKKIVLLKRRIIQPKPHNGIFSRRNKTSGVRWLLRPRDDVKKKILFFLKIIDNCMIKFSEIFIINNLGRNVQTNFPLKLKRRNSIQCAYAQSECISVHVYLDLSSCIHAF